jgi:predicted PhzF superfamily epimerase YddE/YHI9
LAGYWAPHLYLLASPDNGSSTTYRARMFAPAMGIDEDPVTGSTAKARAGYLAPLEARPAVYIRTKRQHPKNLAIHNMLQDTK